MGGGKTIHNITVRTQKKKKKKERQETTTSKDTSRSVECELDDVE